MVYALMLTSHCFCKFRCRLDYLNPLKSYKFINILFVATPPCFVYLNKFIIYFIRQSTYSVHSDD